MTVRPALRVHLVLLLVVWTVAVPVGALQVSSLVVLPIVLIAAVWLEARRLPSTRAPILIVGSTPTALKLIAEIEAPRHPRYAVAGIIHHERPDADSPNAARWLGPCERLADIVAQVHPACIVVAAEDRDNSLPLTALLETRVRGIPVVDALDFYERLTGKIAIEALHPIALIMSNGFRSHGAAETLARFVSRVVVFVALILLAPLLAALALAIAVDSHGPILFVQSRAGRNGRPFGLLKFRTMHPCTEARSEWVTDNLDRITPLGRWLRRFRLDELPQLVNVLRGEMDLIGPRPHPTANHAAFAHQIAYYGLRNSLRPGVTGWAQVRYGYANNLEEETEKMRYDLYYIKNRSPWLDLRILFETVGIMIFGQGASAVRRPSPSRSELLPASPRRREQDGLAVAQPWDGGQHERIPAPWRARSAAEHHSASGR